MTNFDLAPPPVSFDGKSAVPIDIDTIDARLAFDGAAQAASGDATITFSVGPHAGRPIFDLRQTVTGVWLDGAPLPTTQVLTRNLGGGTGSDVRVLDVELAAGSNHTIRVTYTLGVPASSMAGSYLPSLTWAPGPALVFNFGFTDLGAGRYLEAWVPANLIWDQYAINLELLLTGSAVPHRVITNGTVTPAGAHHWQIAFPARCTAFSPLVEIRAESTLASTTSTVTLPVSGTAVTIEVWKLAASTLNLATTAANIAAWLADNETTVGRYLHDNRFVAFMIQGGMEYDGACTSSAGALQHEAFHSWWGRGLKPASQSDAWWDEGWNVYHDAGGAGVQPFDFTEAPVTLSSRNGYSRVTPSIAYTTGERFFEGVAALTTPAALNALMALFYRDHLNRPVMTLELEEFLVAKSGQPDLVDAFHRWVYGFAEPSSTPNLWLRDDSSHAGTESWGGRFWDSPDLWVRHRDDGGTTHQAPRAGQDNWFYARIRNQGAGTARHFMVTFHVKHFAGVQFTWPTDFLPAIAAAGGFELGPGDTRVVKARWPAALVPAAGSHACWLAAVLARSDHPAPGAHVWEHGNLAQKNLTIIVVKRGKSLLLPFVLKGLFRNETRQIEIVRSEALAGLEASLLPRTALPVPPPPADISDAIECGQLPAVRRRGREPIIAGESPDFGAEGFDAASPIRFPPKPVARVSTRLPLGQTTLGLVLTAAESMTPGTRGLIDLINRTAEGKLLGGLSIEIVVE